MSNVNPPLTQTHFWPGVLYDIEYADKKLNNKLL